MRAQNYLVAKIIAASMTLIPTAFSNAANDETVTVEMGDRPRGGGWDKGTLTLQIKKSSGERKRLTIEFSGERMKFLTSLVIETDDWSVDATKYVNTLPSPLPARTVIVMPNWSASRGIGELGLEMPYKETKENGTDDPDETCMLAELIIRNGHVDKLLDVNAPFTRCMQ